MNSTSGSALRAVGALAVMAAIAGAPTSASAQSPSGTVSLEVGQAGYVGDVSRGEGVLHFRGQNYPFVIAGAGVGGVGVSRFEGRGAVYHLRSVEDFAGPFAQVRSGFSLGLMGRGELVLRNRNGVEMKLRGARQGLSLSLGADAMVVSFK